VGVMGLIAVKILAPGFYVHADLRTPVKISIIVLVVTQIVNAILVFYVVPAAQRHAALALGTSVGALINAWLLLRGLRARGHYAPHAGWAAFTTKIFIALVLLAAVCIVGRDKMGPWTGVTETSRIAKLFGLLIGAGGAYLGALFAMGFRPRDFKH
jgi:putative peptidoglycan lipid II flippase